MSKHAVVIVGAGPTGMMLAGELALAGVDVAIVERRESPEIVGSRAGGLHSRTLEILDQRGIAERFISQGTLHKFVHFHVPLDISDFPTRHNYVLGLWQSHIERILAGWIDELKVPVYRGREVTDFTQDDSGVNVTLSDGNSLQADYLVGCDGGRSVIRKGAGIEFRGWDPTTSWLIAEVQASDEPELGFRYDAAGVHGIARTEKGFRIVITERVVGPASEPTLGDVSDALIGIYGKDFGIHSPTWVSRFTDMTRQAVAYRDRRVLLAGDAAHIHPPVGGQGLNIGVQDAVNLGWKLAQVIKQTSPASLLDTYHTERHPIAARVLKNTMVQTMLRRQDDRTKSVGVFFSELLAMDQPRKRMVAEMSGLDVHYDIDATNGDKKHPLLGRRMPDLDLQTADGQQRVFTLLHRARPVLLNLGEPASLDIAAWADLVPSIDAKYSGPWELPAIGTVTAPSAALVRPDGHVAWVGAGTRQGLTEALTLWFGPGISRTDG